MGYDYGDSSSVSSRQPLESATAIPLGTVPSRAHHPQEPSPMADTKYDRRHVEAPVPVLAWSNQPSLPLPLAPVYSNRKQLLWWAARYASIFMIIFIALLVPIIVCARDADTDPNATPEDVRAKQYRNLVFYLCMWLEVTLVSAVFFDAVALALPYTFRLVARYINPAHQRYWRIFKFMRRPICFLGTTIVTNVFFTAFVQENDLLAVNVGKDRDSPYMSWDDIIADILGELPLWVALYFVEKVGISYIAVHYHYRRTNKTLQRTKDIHDALIILYDASIYLHPANNGIFAQEDAIIRTAKGEMQNPNRIYISSYLARLGLDGYKYMSFLGNVISSAPNAHWFRPTSSYATIERAWVNRTAAEALAKRIWLSLVPQGSESLTASDITQVLGDARAAEAQAIFRVFDEEENGNIYLDDFVGMVTEAGQKKHHVFRTIIDMDHCINTLDWLCLLILAAVMIFFIMLHYVPSIKAIQTVLSSLAIGLSFAVGRTFNHVLTGIIFVFFDHPFDSGDVVRVRDKGDGGIVCKVKRQSLIYTVFQRLDNNSDLQLSNDELLRKSIENYTRSEINRQRVVMPVDFRTSFKDLDRLRTLLDEFIHANHRDYVPGSLAVNVTSLHELNKIELGIAFTHRNNWSDEKLRSMRSNKFYCNLVAACRQIPLFKPGSLTPAAGENGNPLYTTQLDPSDVANNIQNEKDRRQGLRWDSSNVSKGPEVTDTTQEDAKPKAASVARVEQDAFEKVSRSKKRSAATTTTGVEVRRNTTGLRQMAMRYFN